MREITRHLPIHNGGRGTFSVQAKPELEGENDLRAGRALQFEESLFGAVAWKEKTGRNSKADFKVSGEVGVLLVSKFEGHFLDALALLQALVSVRHAKLFQPAADFEAVMLFKMPFKCSKRNLAQPGHA